jgi:hypothetical protein
MPCLLTLALLLIAGVSVPLTAQEVVENLHLATDSTAAQGHLDWSRRSLTVYGEGVAPAGVTDAAQRRLMGFRAAQTVAYRNLLELAGQIRVDAQTTVSMAMVADDSLRARVQGLIRGARVVPDSRTEEDGVYRVAVRLDLSSGLGDALLPPAGAPPATAPPAGASAIPYVPSKPYTGLLIDARGLDLRPSMAPRIVDDEGSEVYSAGHVDRAYAARLGTVGYDRDPERARTSDRLGGAQARPLVLKAQRAAGPYRADAVLTREDGIRARMADLEGHFLAQCRVVFVVGPGPSGGN